MVLNERFRGSQIEDSSVSCLEQNMAEDDSLTNYQTWGW